LEDFGNNYRVVTLMQLTFDGTRFDVLDEGRGPAIVLLHGFPLAKEIWDAQARALVADARVIRFDLRGLGGSSAPPGPYLMESLAGDVAGVLDALGVGRAAIVGHSLGGFVAFAFFRMFAERCTALGLVCTVAAEDDGPVAAARLELALQVEREGIAALHGCLKCLVAPGALSHDPVLLARLQSIVDATSPAGAAAMLRGMAARAASDDLFEEIGIPVRVVAGARDVLVPLETGHSLARAIAAAELDVLDCGHLPPLEAPDALTLSLERLIASALPGG
jgi:pimeloyl-ACP methyl ester carboxylesterase